MLSASNPAPRRDEMRKSAATPGMERGLCQLVCTRPPKPCGSRAIPRVHGPRRGLSVLSRSVALGSLCRPRLHTASTGKRRSFVARARPRLTLCYALDPLAFTGLRPNTPAPAKRARGPSRSSMRRASFHLAMRSPRANEPTFNCPVCQPIAKCTIVVSSVSPERADTIAA